MICRHVLALSIVAGMLAPQAALAWTLNGDADTDMIRIGCVGTSLYACVDGSMYFIQASTSSCALQSSGTVNGSGGNDSIMIVFQGGYASCGATSYKWVPPTNNGFYSIAVNGGTGNDDITGGLVRGVLHGDDGDDNVVLHYSYGSAYGDAGEDFIWGNTTGDNEDLYGGTDADCMLDDTDTADTFDCGDSLYDGYIGDPTPNDNCERDWCS